MAIQFLTCSRYTLLDYYFQSLHHSTVILCTVCRQENIRFNIEERIVCAIKTRFFSSSLFLTGNFIARYTSTSRPHWCGHKLMLFNFTWIRTVHCYTTLEFSIVKKGSTVHLDKNNWEIDINHLCKPHRLIAEEYVEDIFTFCNSDRSQRYGSVKLISKIYVDDLSIYFRSKELLNYQAMTLLYLSRVFIESFRFKLMCHVVTMKQKLYANSVLREL